MTIKDLFRPVACPHEICLVITYPMQLPRTLLVMSSGFYILVIYPENYPRYTTSHLMYNK
jgi:hypothetical protein